MPFVKGQSGNPSGRPKDRFGEFIRNDTKDGKELVQKVLHLLRKSEDEDIQMKAVTWLADRGWGKSVQPVEAEVTETKRMVLIFPEESK